MVSLSTKIIGAVIVCCVCLAFGVTFMTIGFIHYDLPYVRIGGVGVGTFIFFVIFFIVAIYETTPRKTEPDKKSAEDDIIILYR